MSARAPKARCSDPLHHGSEIRAWGTFTLPSGRYRRYRCEPQVGDVHFFSVGIEGGRRRRGIRGAPDCTDHTGSTITRHGTYRRATAQPRQRYLCEHERCNAKCRPGCTGAHTFTPPLPRAHVHSGEACAECLELRGFHRGEIASARRHRLWARLVARLLWEMSGGMSYVKAGRLALESAKIALAPHRRTAPPPTTTATANRRLNKRLWHIGANIIEAFAPVVWAKTEAKLRARAAANKAAGFPVVWILDEKPVFAIDKRGKRKKTAGYSVFLLAEADWSDPVEPGIGKLRLVRALPKNTSIAWRLLFDEVGGVPDLVLSDAAPQIIAAVGAHFPGAGPLFVPSLYHVAQALRRNALDDALKGPSAFDISRHLGGLARNGAAMASVAGWTAWWDELERLSIASGAVKLDDLRKSRTNYEDRMATALPALLADPRLRMSTGGLESLLHDWVDPILERRQHSFANIERTNHLFDLAVSRAEGDLTHPNEVAALIEEDELPHGGWTVPLVSIRDRQPPIGRYRSLRDEFLMNTVAAERGIA